MAATDLTELASPAGAPWTNWVGNQTSTPGYAAAPRSEEEVVALVRQAAERGIGVRVAGAGHSFTPVVQTDGLHLDLSAMRGVVATDPGRRRATALAGTRIHDFYEPLWEAGLALRNQGDIDTQHVAGAVATSTHGSGTRFTSLSGAVRRMRIVTASGEVLDVGEDRPDLLHAAQTSVGMLGVVTQLELAVTEAYRLQQQVGLWSWDDVMEQWDDLVATHRHFGMFWLPSEESGALYNLDGHGEPMADRCYVKIYDEVGPDVPDSDVEGRRVDRCYRIFPMVYDANFHELEYFVPLERGPEALQAMRRLMLARLPESVYPLEVRTVGADEAWLSPQHRQATTVISVSGAPGTDYWDYLRSVDALLADFGARPHWGKLHFLTRDRLHALYPRADDFTALRRELDPAGMFLNDHLRPLFG
ncbi:FAD/FMN-containing dehydrogenase [Nocardioides scoriae]|uniref:FAD/FMN-containing dehydrogenase n=1 Tax=Nocardioides scoriae TaxID=642780 RepID=A0A1H1P869_9ACTN|nr:D-arabinono-1,4-lactone oxidase [Nocardioides scoriae]SDS07441.1 FAD/FMN-containing dehydrogenase [Nocardioides scoriae]